MPFSIRRCSLPTVIATFALAACLAPGGARAQTSSLSRARTFEVKETLFHFNDAGRRLLVARLDVSVANPDRFKARLIPIKQDGSDAPWEAGLMSDGATMYEYNSVQRTYSVSNAPEPLESPQSDIYGMANLDYLRRPNQPIPPEIGIKRTTAAETLDGRPMSVRTEIYPLDKTNTGTPFVLTEKYWADVSTGLPYRRILYVYKNGATSAIEQTDYRGWRIDQPISASAFVWSPTPAYKQAGAPRLLRKGTLAPDFTAIGPTGAPVRLSDYRGKIVVLDFWGTWCPACTIAMPNLQSVYQRVKDKNVAVLAVSVNDEKSAYENWVAANAKKFSFPTAHDPSGKTENNLAFQLYHVTGYPTQYIIAADGRVFASYSGYNTRLPLLENALKRIGVDVDGAPKAASNALGAQPRAISSSSANPQSAPHIRFTATASPAALHPGETATVTVTASIDAGWHIYSSVPSSDGPIPTEIASMTGAAPLGATTEDPPRRKLDAGFGKEVAFHEGSAAFRRQFRITEKGAGSVTIHYEICNDRVCLPPRDAVLPLTLTVTPGAARPEYSQESAAVSPNPSSAQTAPRSRGDSAGLALFLFAAFGGGLLALMTPCVFPLIPITLTNFVKQADGDKARLARLAGGYAMGVAALYVALGAVATVTVGASGINRLASDPWINLGMFVVFVVFALSFFETITLSLPGNLSALQTAARNHGGLLGLAILGVTFVLASFTCTAPFLGTLLVAAAAGERTRPLLGMSAFALAFTSPFLIFALFPQWIGKLPRSGVWLARVKATLGFIELAAALKFLSNADQVWGWKLLTQPVLLAAWALIFACAAFYLWGTLRFGVAAETEARGVRVPPARAAFALLFFLLAGDCVWGLAGGPIPLMNAFLPPAGYGVAGAGSEDGLTWLTDYDSAIAQAKAEGKPLFIDFTGVTCTNCRWNEKNVFPRPAVRAELEKYVRVRLYTDRPGDAANQKLQLTKFGDVALPLYGVVDSRTGDVIDKVGGTIDDAGAFARFLAHGAASAQSPANQ